MHACCASNTRTLPVSPFAYSPAVRSRNSRLPTSRLHHRDLPTETGPKVQIVNLDCTPAVVCAARKRSVLFSCTHLPARAVLLVRRPRKLRQATFGSLGTHPLLSLHRLCRVGHLASVAQMVRGAPLSVSGVRKLAWQRSANSRPLRFLALTLSSPCRQSVHFAGFTLHVFVHSDRYRAYRATSRFSLRTDRPTHWPPRAALSYSEVQTRRTRCKLRNKSERRENR